MRVCVCGVCVRACARVCACVCVYAGVRACACACVHVRVRVRVRVHQIIALFSSLCAAVTLCTSKHCQYNESVHRKEEHASLINTIPY